MKLLVFVLMMAFTVIMPCEGASLEKVPSIANGSGPR